MGWLGDIKTAVRRMRRTPWTTTVILLTLALAIGATGALFSVTRALLLDPFPYQDHKRLAMAVGVFPKADRQSFSWSPEEILELRERKDVLEEVITGRRQDVNLTGGDVPERVGGVRVSANVFPTLGVEPQLGRVFNADEDRPGGEPVVVISYGFWQSHFGGSEAALGEVLTAEGESSTVIGVMPRRFAWWGADLWFPLALDLTTADPRRRNMTAVVKVVEGVSLEQAEVALESTARRREQALGGEAPEYEGWKITLRSYLDMVVSNVRPALLVLLGVVGLVLLIACANIANLLLAQVARRGQEIALRSALGARRSQVMRQLFVESIALSTIGGVLGVLLSGWGVKILLALIPGRYIPKSTIVTVSPPVILAALGVSLLVGLIFGLAPAFQVRRMELVDQLKEGGRQGDGGRRGGRLRSALVVAEVALAMVVLVGAALMLQSFDRLLAIDPGFEPSNALAMRVSLDRERYGEPAQIKAFYRDALARVEALPGVEASGATYRLPLAPGGPLVRPVAIEGRSVDDVGGLLEAQYEIVTGHFFQAMATPLLRGRVFAQQDTEESQSVALINQTFADRYFAGEDPTGQRLKRGGADSEFQWRTIVGVVGDMVQENLEGEPRPAFFVPFVQSPVQPRALSLVVRTAGGPEAAITSVRRALAQLDPLQPVYEVETLEDRVTEEIGGVRLAATLFAFFAGLAVLLAVLGIFALMAYSVSQRTPEIGVRMAFGADAGKVFRLILRRAFNLAVSGVALGVVVSLLASKSLSGLIFGLSLTDPSTFVVAGVFFIVVALLAAYLPALRATRIDPLVALHHQ